MKLNSTGNTTETKKEGKSRFRRVNDWLHLWLGLASGIIVFIVCITGCIWVFNEEIMGLIQHEYNVPAQERAVLTPSQIQDVAQRTHPGKVIEHAYYLQGRAI